MSAVLEGHLERERSSDCKKVFSGVFCFWGGGCFFFFFFKVLLRIGHF